MMPRQLDYTGRRITIVGLAREGTALAEFFARRGAVVTVSDRRTEPDLAGPMARLAGLSIHYSLGANRVEDCQTADEVYASPGVPWRLEALQAARTAAIPVRSETQLFFELCPAPIVGVTGSSGKSTTTSLIGHILTEDHREVVVGGNIGRTVIDRLEDVTRDSWVVMELSSFQLQFMVQSPHIAVVTNLTPNHLDVHESMAEYAEAKRQIFVWQKARDFAVLNRDDPGAWSLRDSVRGELLEFSRRDVVTRGTFVHRGWIWLRTLLEQRRVLPVGEIPLRGQHNVENVLAAAAAAHAAGVDDERIADAVRTFRPLPHRLEPVGVVRGVEYVNDSIATSPERTIAALRATAEPAILLLGGRDKHLPLRDLVEECAQRCRRVVVFGEAAPLLERAFQEHGRADLVRRATGLADAVEVARSEARAGDAVLLSPACTSFDEFRDFEERGETFRRLVGAMQE